ncbi:MAG: hypothetical protein VR72_07425 [Clostridiaceae bacterium BRH_c20a]|nr:MAG: hypothetical protein VR72_07425 [Clostridiaceae bacterium BRH_c20a]
MKKLFTIALTGVMLLSFTGFAFAANAVSDMATTKGGQHVAKCAQSMDKGISECAKAPECVKM